MCIRSEKVKVWKKRKIYNIKKKKRTLIVKFERRKVFFFGKQRRKVQ